MCKTTLFNNIQNALIIKAQELNLAQNIQTSLGYSIALGDLITIVDMSANKEFQKFFTKTLFEEKKNAQNN